MTGKYKTLLSNTLIFAIGSVGSRIITFLLVPLYTNILSTEQYGTADFVMTCSYLVVPIISLVIQDAILRFGLSRKSDVGKIARNALVVFGAGVLGMLLMLPLISLHPILAQWKWQFFVLVISNNASNILFAYAKAKEQNKLYAVGSVLQTLSLAVVNLVLLVQLRWGVRGYLIGNMAANLVPSIVIFIKTGMYRDIRGAQFDGILLKQMLRYSIPLIANNLSWWILNSADRVMLEHYLSASELGLFTAAAKIPGLLSVVTSIFSSAWTISSIKEYDSDQDKGFYSTVFSAFNLTMCLGASFVILIVKPFMHIYVGADFFRSWQLVPLLVLGAVYFAYASFFGAIYDAAKKNVVIAITTFAAAIVNILVNFLLIGRIGVLAASVSTAVGYATIGLFRMFHSRKYFTFPIRYGEVAWNSLILIAQTVLVTMDVFPYAVSIIAILLLLAGNRQSFKALFQFVQTKVGKEHIDEETK